MNLENYSRKAQDNINQEDCDFCSDLSGNNIHIQGKSFSILENKYPYEKDHFLLISNRHVNLEIEFTEEEWLELNKIHKTILTTYNDQFSSCLYLTRQNTPDQSMWHWHRHYLPTDLVLRNGIARVPHTSSDLKF